MAELDYLAALEETYKKRKWRLSQKAEREVINLYGKALQDLATELEKTGGLKGRFIKGRMHSLYQDLYKLQKDSITAAAYMSNAFNEDIMNRIGTSAKMNHAFGQLFKSIPLETILAMEKGKLYKDGLGLSKRLWLYVEGNGTQIEHILKQGFIQGTSAKDLAGILAEHVNPACRKIWPRERVKELLGPGYSSANKPLEYNAMRLARTSISHAYSLNNRLASAKNPFIDGFIWHSAFAHGRTCEICKERDGQHFTAKDMPYDHPNGLCWEEPYLPKSLDEYGKEIGDWARGGKNPLLDAWWKKVGSDEDKPTIKKDKAEKEISLQESIQKRYGFKFDFSEAEEKLDDRVMGYIEKTLSNIEKNMPENYKPEDLIKSIKFYDGGRGTLGSAYRGEISLNTYYYRTHRENAYSFTDILEDLEDMYKSKSARSSAKNLNPLSTLTHEYGHLVHDEILYRSGKGNTDVSGAGLKTQNDQIRKEVLSKFDLSASKKDAGKVAEMLSDYATESSHEFFAEAFMEKLDNPNPRPLAEEFWKVMEDRIKKATKRSR